MMYPDVTFGQTSKKTLAQDDKNGLQALYPKSGCPSPPPPDTSCGGTNPPDGGPKSDGGSTAGDGAITKQDSGPASDGAASSEGGASSGDSGGKQCTQTSQCAEGEVCTAEGRCIPTGDEGCSSCDVSTRVRSRPPFALLALALLLLIRVSGRGIPRRSRPR